MVDESRVCALDSAQVIDVGLTKDPRSFARCKEILHISAFEPCANRCAAHVGSGGWRLKKARLHAYKEHGLPLPSDLRGLAVVVDLLNGGLFDALWFRVCGVSSDRERQTQKQDCPDKKQGSKRIVNDHENSTFFKSTPAQTGQREASRATELHPD